VRGTAYGKILGGGLDGFESEVVELLDWFFGFGGEEAGFVDEGLVDGSLAVAGEMFAGRWRHDAGNTPGFGVFVVLWSWCLWGR
jgi:hypothetical protein